MNAEETARGFAGQGGAAATSVPVSAAASSNSGKASAGCAPAAEATSASITAPWAIDIRNLSFAYPQAPAPVLDKVNWSVPQGAFALLVGGTGSGKSTLLSLIKPEITPAGEREGEILIQGRSIESLEPAESAGAIGYVFQNPDNQLVCESVWHEMAFGLENLGTPQDEMRRLIAETSYFFGIDDWFRAQTDTLSGGRKQLLALASTLVMQPSLLLLDEPTAQLDPVAERNFLHALFRVNRELGCTVVVATHRPQPMIDYATCAFELVDGTVRKIADMGSLAVRAELLGAGEAARDADSAPRASSPSTAAGTDAAPAQPAANPAANQDSASQQPSLAPAPGSPACPSRPALTLDRAWFRYDRDGAWILRNLDLPVRAGSIHALVGGNGCGKSTLLSIAAGSAKLQRGKLAAASKSRVLLPQDPRALFAAETALDELMEWSRAVGYDCAAAQRMLERMGLAGAADLHPYDLSGGQQQLLALGKLLLIEPDILLLDEPTKGLDAPARRMLARVLVGLRAQGKTVLMATHDLDFAQQVADTVSMMFDGEIASTEPTAEFFKNNVYYRP